MDPRENPKLTPPQEGTQNPNPQPTKTNKEIDEGLRSPRILVQDLWNARYL
jgi:hypothetical protein